MFYLLQIKEFHMGFNQSSAKLACADKASTVTKNDLFGAVLAGFGIWPTPAAAAQEQQHPSASNVYPLQPPLRLPLRVIRIKDGNSHMAGRMVISGRMADVCAELDRMAA
jgi:hypothetical protein